MSSKKKAKSERKALSTSALQLAEQQLARETDKEAADAEWRSRMQGLEWWELVMLMFMLVSGTLKLLHHYMPRAFAENYAILSSAGSYMGAIAFALTFVQCVTGPLLANQLGRPVWTPSGLAKPKMYHPSYKKEMLKKKVEKNKRVKGGKKQLKDLSTAEGQRAATASELREEMARRQEDYKGVCLQLSLLIGTFLVVAFFFFVENVAEKREDDGSLVAWNNFPWNLLPWSPAWNYPTLKHGPFAGAGDAAAEAAVAAAVAAAAVEDDFGSL